MSSRPISPYTPGFFRAIKSDTKPVQMSYSDFELSDSNSESIESFKYDPLNFPLKSTQQLNVDWSKFENHAFFSSAEVKVNDAFNKVINSYPFDGTKKEVEEFLDSLTGFEKWVFDRFPTWKGALLFSGTQVGEDPANGYSSSLGTWISVKDKSGNMFPDLAKNNKGETILNPDDDTSVSIEAIVFLPTQANDTQVIFQKSSSSSEGFTFYLSPSASTVNVSAIFSVCSGSNRLSVSGDLKKGAQNHICLILNKETRENSLQLFVNEELKSQSKESVRIKKMGIDEADFLIGSGSSFFSSNSLVTPTQTFSGSLDELRIFHSVRDVKTQKLHASRGLYTTPDLKLYYRFNEPSGSLTINNNNAIESIVLDSSGNSLHANISNFDPALRINASVIEGNILVNESRDASVVLFPAYKEILDFNASLLVTASNYDRNNPNNILRLVPQHYLLEGALQDGFETIEGNGGQPYGGSGIPGQGQRGSVQIILSFLYIWAKFFDEIKTYIDAFSTLKTVGYDLEETIPDNFLEDFVKSYGFYMPRLFNNSTLEQFAEGKNIEGLTDTSTPLKKIQSIILRRVLVNLPDVVRSKGTQHSIKSFLRSVGIDPENSLKIREYGGSTVKQITASREKKTEPGAMVDFLTSSFVSTMPLSASRVEPGYPLPAGVFYTDSSGKIAGTTSQSDGLLTSGSWNIEAIFKFPPQKISLISDADGSQSLFRVAVTGSAAGVSPGIIANVVATQSVDYPAESASVKAYLRPGMSSASPLLIMSVDLDGAGIFDGDKWNVSIGCERNDSIDSSVSSSYYLRVAKCEAGDIVSSYVTSSYFYEQASGEGNAFRQISPTHNASGSFICVGKNQTISSGPTYSYLNDTLDVDDEARTKDFIGWMSNLRFWSKSMTVEEWKEHARNPKSSGVSNPLVNYNFVKNVEGSFEKIRLETMLKQPNRSADSSGNIRFLDFSLNSLETVGSGFVSGSKVVVGDLFSYSYLSPAFDEAATDDKIRLRSFEQQVNLEENPWAVPAPSYLSNSIFQQEEPQDDLRLSIEFSMVDSLDRDIVTMFSSFDSLNDMIGRPELMFSPDYPDLDRMRDVYFNRLSGKPDFRKFLEFYRWFDISISTFIDQLIPSKTSYKGTNYVVESHMLERHKNVYRHSGNYLGQRQFIEDGLLVQQVVGKLRKY